MNQSDVIRFIADHTIPVALNLYVIRKQAGPAGDFFRGAQKQRPAQYQGLYLVAPDGKVLASHQAFKSPKSWPQEVLADLEPGLKAFGTVKRRDVERRDPLPQRGLGLQADGGATLALYLRTSIGKIPLRELPNPTIDSLSLSAKEWDWLAPPRAEKGAEWKIPQELAVRLSRLLGPHDENSMPRPHEVASVTLTGTVEEVRDGIAYLVYAGQLSGAHVTHDKKRTQAEAKLTGVGRYHVKNGRLLSLVWVAEGVYRAPPPYDQPQTYSAVVEWLDAPPRSGARSRELPDAPR